MSEVQGCATFARVEWLEERAESGCHRRKLTSGIANPGFLQFDHVGAEVAQHLPGHRSLGEDAQVEHPQVC